MTDLKTAAKDLLNAVVERGHLDEGDGGDPYAICTVCGRDGLDEPDAKHDPEMACGRVEAALQESGA